MEALLSGLGAAFIPSATHEFMTYYRWIDSPIGKLLLAGDGHLVERLHFSRGPQAATLPDPSWVEDPSAFRDATTQLDSYFAGQLREFTVELNLSGTPFQQTVWRHLREIPYGQTISYGELARRIGNPAASRAVGLANGANPVAIIIPCHRVIGANGKLTGFGGGLDVKERLLALERGERILDLNAHAHGTVRI